MTDDQKTSKAMNLILWLAQFLLAFIFIWAGAMKLLKPGALPWPWIAENPGLVKITGIFDLLAGVGIVLPALLRIKPILTIYAAYGAVLLMIAASVFHISRGEGDQIGFNIFVVFTAAFIVWGRQKKAPIS